MKNNNRIITKENCAHIKEWDYNKGKQLVEIDACSQNDWNQTLMTSINFIANYIHKCSRRNGPNTIKLHPSLLPLIKTLRFYNEEDNLLGGRYNVVTDNEIELDIIYVYHTEEVLAIPIITEATDSDWGMIEFKFLNDCTQEQIDDYIKSTQGYVQIINHINDWDELENAKLCEPLKSWDDESKEKTLEDAAKNFYPILTSNLICSPKLVRDGFITGAKWMEKRTYSEDEVKELIMKALTHTDYKFCGALVTAQQEIRTANFNIWFEEYKKK